LVSTEKYFPRSDLWVGERNEVESNILNKYNNLGNIMKNITEEIDIFNNDSLIHLGNLADLIRSMNEISIQCGVVLYKVGVLVLRDYCKFNNKTEFSENDFVRSLTIKGLIESYNSEWFKTKEFKDEVKYYLAGLTVDCTKLNESVSDAALEQHNNALEFVKLSLALGPSFP
jgi:hypothetical protein